MHNKKVLGIGYGKMGNLYARYVTSMGASYNYYDPYVSQNSNAVDSIDFLDDYSHIIISTPPETHFDLYSKVVDTGFTGSIYIDKPVVTSPKYQQQVFMDKRVFCGMTERFNPVVSFLKNTLNKHKIISAKFTRCYSAPETMDTPVLFDLGIHDIDLYMYLFDKTIIPVKYEVFEKDKTCCLLLKQQDGAIFFFEWSHNSFKSERKIVIMQSDVVYEVDLVDQTIVAYKAGGVVENLYVEKGSTIKAVMREFLRGGSCSSVEAHKFMFRVICKIYLGRGL